MLIVWNSIVWEEKGKLCDCAENRKENLFLGQLNYDYSSFNHFHLAGSTGYYDKADLFTRESLWDGRYPALLENFNKNFALKKSQELNL